MSSYTGKVIYASLYYREYKSRCETIEKFEGKIDSVTVSALTERNGGIDYSKDIIQTSNNYDPTSDLVIKVTYDKWDEYLKKIKLVELVELAYDGLSPIEQFIMEQKYMTRYKLKDSMVYTDPEFPYSRSKYYGIFIKKSQSGLSTDYLWTLLFLMCVIRSLIEVYVDPP